MWTQGMRPVIGGFLVGLLLTAVPALAFHYFGHDPNVEQQERFQQQWERSQQEQFRNEQRQQRFLNPC